MPAVGDPLLKDQIHELLGRRRHIFKSLAERNNGKAHALEVLYHLDSSPAVKGDLTDIEPVPEILDELLDKSVMNDIAFGRFEIAFLLPEVVRNVITPHTKINVVLRNPEVGENHIFIRLIPWREDEDKGCDIRCGRKVETAIADTALQLIRIHGKGTGVPFVHRHPADGLLYPLVQP